MDDVRGYSEGLRWQKYPQAAVRIPPAEREEFLDEQDELETDLRIGDYEITRLRVDKSKNRASVRIRWTWHRDSEGIVHTTTSHQTWQRRGKRWLMVEERRLKGEAMPGVPEPSVESEPEPRENPTSMFAAPRKPN